MAAWFDFSLRSLANYNRYLIEGATFCAAILADDMERLERARPGVWHGWIVLILYSRFGY